MARRESDQLIVLGDGRADHRGKGLTGVRSWHRKHCPARKGRKSNANLTASNSNKGTREQTTPVSESLSANRRAVSSRELVVHPTERGVWRGSDQRETVRRK